MFPPLWQSTINPWNNKGGICTQTPAISKGSKQIWLSPRYWALTECDNYTFPFPFQPPGDGRFSTLSHTLSLRNFLWLLTSTGGWKRNQVVWDLQQGFVWKSLPFAGQMLVALCKYCHHWPAKVAHLNLCKLLHVSKWAAFNPLPCAAPWLFRQVPSWDCQHYYNLWSCTAIGSECFLCTFILAEA